jgi:hypothetical protein
VRRCAQVARHASCGHIKRTVFHLAQLDLAFPRSIFSRIQINVGVFPVPWNNFANLLEAIRGDTWISGQTIIQLTGGNDWMLPRLLQEDIDAAGLFDGSGGTGKKPARWPNPVYRCPLGYAGSLGPDGLLDDLSAIERASGGHDFWIDMEASLRSRVGGLDVFDMAKCRRVLELAAPRVRDFTPRVQPPADFTPHAGESHD